MNDLPQINQSTNQLISYSLHLADNALILGQRNAEWTGHGPILEQDIAISNIALDLIGQARNFYQYAAMLINRVEITANATEDTLAYLRNPGDFKNCLLVELEKGDWAVTVLRQFLFSTYQFYLYQLLQTSADTTLSAIAEKSLKEVTYHLRWSAEWVIRLGDGTEESHRRITKSLQLCWPFTDELTNSASYELELSKQHIAVNCSAFKDVWHNKVNEVFKEANLQAPIGTKMQTGGKEGKHSARLTSLMDEMQQLQRAHPGAAW